MRRILAVLLVIAGLLLIALVSVNWRETQHVRALESARERALELMPDDVILNEESNESSHYLFRGTDPSGSYYYEIRMNKEREQELTYRIWVAGVSASSEVKLEQADIEAIVQRDFPGAQILQLRLAQQQDSPSQYYYKVQFIQNDIRGEYTLNPENGDLMESILRYGQPIILMPVSGEDLQQLEEGLTGLAEEGNSGVPSGNEDYLELDEVRSLLHSSWPSAEIGRLEYKEHDGSLIVKAELHQNEHGLQLMIDARNGAILNEEGINWVPDTSALTESSGISTTEAVTVSAPTDSSTGESEPATTETTSAAASEETTEPTAPAETTVITSTAASTSAAATTEPTPVTTEKPAPTTAAPVTTTTAAATTKAPVTTTKATEPEIISEARATQIALAKEDDMYITSLTLTRAGGRIYYAGVGFEDDDEMYIFEIDAVSGYIIHWEEIDLDDDDWDDDD